LFILKIRTKNPSSPQSGKKGKENRKWIDGADVETLDYTDKTNEANGHHDLTTSQYASVRFFQYLSRIIFNEFYICSLFIERSRW
jgi:hypothetical protein